MRWHRRSLTIRFLWGFILVKDAVQFIDWLERRRYVYIDPEGPSTVSDGFNGISQGIVKIEDN
jgi:hypothetical protein